MTDQDWPEFEEHPTYCRPDPDGVTQFAPYVLIERDEYTRARSCVNAMTGIKDPQKFREAAEACFTLVGWLYVDDLGTENEKKSMQEALRLMREAGQANS